MMIQDLEGLAHRPYFFDDGLAFGCRRCGACCTGDPGIVYFAEDCLPAVALYMGLSMADLISGYLALFQAGYRVREDSDGRCLFYDPDQGCRIYPVRPFRCRTFPFWFENLRSRALWLAIARVCPGIGSGALYSRVAILAAIDLDLAESRKRAVSR